MSPNLGKAAAKHKRRFSRVNSNRKKNIESHRKRKSRVGGKTTRLYHETSEANAEQILKSRKMLRGQAGWAGAGIYFAKTPAAKHAKSHNKGVVLSADVLLGTVKYVNGTEALPFSLET